VLLAAIFSRCLETSKDVDTVCADVYAAEVCEMLPRDQKRQYSTN